MGTHDLWLFIAAGLLLNVTPGPDMALVIARSAQHGTRAGIAAALGIGAGSCIHIGAAAVGVSALIMASAWAFSVIKWVGAAYLAYIGLRMLWSSFRSGPVSGDPVPLGAGGADLRAFFAQGFLTNLLNPKVAVFFLAFLPQFIDAEAASKAAAFVVLGLIFNLTGTTWNLGVAVFAGWAAGTAMFGRARIWLERLIGTMFAAIGCKLALVDRP